MMNTSAAAFFKVVGWLLYSEPSKDALARIREDGLFAELPFAWQDPDALQGRELVETWLNNASLDELTDAAKSDWLHAMMSVDGVMAPPWGSVYLDKEGLLFTEDTLAVRQFYERHGFTLKEKYHEPDDHIGLELEFMSDLIAHDKTPEARLFAKQFVMPWVGQWADRVVQCAKTDYYRGMALMTVGGVRVFSEG